MTTKYRIALLLVAVMLLVPTMSVFADAPVGFDPQGNEVKWANNNCAKIQSGTIHASTGEILSTGFDVFGYNYQAHEFNGTYDSVDRNLDGKYYGQTGDFVDDTLEMRWSDDWLANVDCNGDHLLDRGLVGTTVAGFSTGYTTNKVNGYYFDSNGVSQHYEYSVKIGYVGPTGDLWNYYTIVQEINNDPAGGFHGVQYVNDPGLGRYVIR